MDLQKSALCWDTLCFNYWSVTSVILTDPAALIQLHAIIICIVHINNITTVCDGFWVKDQKGVQTPLLHEGVCQLCFPPSINHDTAEVHRPTIAGGISSAISHFHNENQWAVNPCWRSYGVRRAYYTETIKQSPPSGTRCSVCICKHTLYIYMYMCVFVSINKKQLHVAVHCWIPSWRLDSPGLQALFFN